EDLAERPRPLAGDELRPVRWRRYENGPDHRRDRFEGRTPHLPPARTEKRLGDDLSPDGHRSRAESARLQRTASVPARRRTADRGVAVSRRRLPLPLGEGRG